VGSSIQPSTLRVLVANEDHRARDAFAGALRARGAEVLEANDGEEALQLAVTHRVDGMVLDMRLPPMPIADFARWIEQLSPDTALICTTAYPSYDDALAALRCHAAEFLEDPSKDPGASADAVLRALTLQREKRKRKEQAHERTELARVDDLRRRFLSAVAHELRPPLTVIKTFATVLTRNVHGPLNTDQSQVVDHIQIEADRLSHEIDKLLSLARLESSDFAPDRALVTVADIVRLIRKRLLARTGEDRVSLVFDLNPPDAALVCDARDISQALLALAENALKFSGDGGRVDVKSRVDGDRVTFTVADTGVGIRQEDLERIFDMFVQIEHPLTRRYGGSGIGLTYAARIVEAHGSKIQVSSEPGEGSTFSFALPISPEAETASASVEVFEHFDHV